MILSREEEVKTKNLTFEIKYYCIDFSYCNEFFSHDVNTVLVAGLRIILKIYEAEFMMWTKIIGTNPFRSNRSEFLPVFLFRMTLSLLMHNSYIYIFFLIVLLLLLKPSFKLTTIRYFFSFFK